MATVTYLAVPYAEKDAAKALGARWDAAKKQWYAPHAADEELVRRWPINTAPVCLHGEDRTFGGNELFVDLITTLVLSVFVFIYGLCPCVYFPMSHTTVRLCFFLYTAPFDTLYLLVMAFAF
jgi:hypothetical protein